MEEIVEWIDLLSSCKRYNWLVLHVGLSGISSPTSIFQRYHLAGR